MIKKTYRKERTVFVVLFAGIAILAASCGPEKAKEAADILLHNGRVYSLTWGEPRPNGEPAPDAPRDEFGWHPDAEAVAIRGDKIIFVGKDRDAKKLRAENTRIIDLQGATVIPGLIESHTHFVELGQSLSVIDVREIESEEEIVASIRHVAISRRAPFEARMDGMLP